MSKIQNAKCGQQKKRQYPTSTIQILVAREAFCWNVLATFFWEGHSGRNILSGANCLQMWLIIDWRRPMTRRMKKDQERQRMTDLLSREYIDRDEKSVGTSSKSLTTLFSNLGNWREVRIGFFLHSLTTRRSTTRKTNQMCIQIMFQRTTNLFLQMIRNLSGHLVLNCEAGSLLPYKNFFKELGWSLCFNDAQDLCCLARLGSLQRKQNTSGWTERRQGRGHPQWS